MTQHTGRVVVVTGATRGIGREVARQLAVRGDRVVLAARRFADGHRTAVELARAGASVEPRQLDVADAGSVARFAEEVARDHAAVDVLVNNAAISYDTDQRASAADLDEGAPHPGHQPVRRLAGDPRAAPAAARQRRAADRQRLERGRVADQHGRWHPRVLGVEDRVERPDAHARC